LSNGRGTDKIDREGGGERKEGRKEGRIEWGKKQAEAKQIKQAVKKGGGEEGRDWV
jgi:hypothetical protein